MIRSIKKSSSGNHARPASAVGNRSWRERKFGNNKQENDQFKKRKRDDKDRQLTEKKAEEKDAQPDYTLEAYYDWDTDTSPYALSSKDEQVGMKSLKSLAAMKLAENHDQIRWQWLERSGWGVWEPVWEYITKWRRDSFSTYQLFANAFGREPGFRSHPSIQSYPETKKKVVMISTFPNSSNHRVERMFSNINVARFINTVNNGSFRNLVILEFAKPLIYDEYLILTNLQNLTSLKISRVNQIPEPIIHSWCSALRSNKWTKLQILSIPEIPQDSFLKLQSVARYCRLLYLEIETMTPFNMAKDWNKLDYENWSVTNDKSLNNLPWGMKSLSILRKFGIENHSISPTASTMCLDFNIVNHSNDSLASDKRESFRKGEHDHIWNMGALQSHHQGLLLKNKLVVPDRGDTVRNPMGGKSLVLKKKLIKPNKAGKSSVDAFFDL